MKRFFLITTILCCPLILTGQELRQYEHLFCKGDDTLNHSSIRNLYPYLNPAQPDSPFRSLGSQSTRFGRAINRLLDENIITLRAPGYRLTADPLLDLELGRELPAGRNTWVNTRGGQVYGKITLDKEKGEGRREKGKEEEDGCDSSTVEFYSSYYESQAWFPGFVDSLAALSGGVPGQGAILRNSGIWDHSYATGWVRYQAKKFFTFEFGTGKNFFGNGYRSMLLSDNARNYPYFRIDTKLWRFHYTNLWAEFQDNRYREDSLGAYQKKYGAFHYLSYSITTRLELSFFEAIIWQGRDSSHTRGFDINYLNPIIFLRPVEWTLGSPDNALIGANLSYKIVNGTYLYGQLLLDEFSFDHLKTRDGYWGNKYAGQIGIKAWIPLKKGYGVWDVGYGMSDKGNLKDQSNIQNPTSNIQYPTSNIQNPTSDISLFVQSEFNFARPYTYSHWTSKQNYGHFGQPIGHPLGANFIEWVNFVRFHYGRFLAEARSSIAHFGANYDTLNFGQDIFLPYTSYVNKYGNFIGQGRSTNLLYNSLTFSFLLSPSSLTNVFCTLTDRREITDSWNKHSFWFTFGIRSSIRNLYYDY